MNNPAEQTQQAISKLITFVEQTPWRAFYLDRLQSLKHQAEQPCVLAIAGRVKAGKSTFLNSLLGKDLAKTGINETTATINVFRKGTPPDPQRQVMVIWRNGRQTFETKEFLDSLQGNDRETLLKAKGIKRLEFLLSDPIFDDITLVDTPGTDAIVGEDGMEHQERSEEFLFLRKLHSEETRKHTENADAVIYLIGQVANSSMQGFMQEFQTATGGDSSAMKAIGVMAKIDLSDEIVKERETLALSIAQKMQHELNTVVPVSAGIWRAMDILRQHHKLEWMQQKLKNLPEEAFNYMMTQEKAYYSNSSIYTRKFTEKMLEPMSLEERKDLKGDMPWRVFAVIAQHLYNYSFDEAVKRLTSISGINHVMDIIRKHFFNRGRVLRCYRISRELRSILNDMERNRLYELAKEVRMKKDFEEFISSHPLMKNNDSTGPKLLRFINTYLKTESEIAEMRNTIQKELIPEVENLQLCLEHTDENFRALQLIEQNSSLFSKEEKEELFALFGMYGDKSLEN